MGPSEPAGAFVVPGGAWVVGVTVPVPDDPVPDVPVPGPTCDTTLPDDPVPDDPVPDDPVPDDPVPDDPVPDDPVPDDPVPDDPVPDDPVPDDPVPDDPVPDDPVPDDPVPGPTCDTTGAAVVGVEGDAVDPVFEWPDELARVGDDVPEGQTTRPITSSEEAPTTATTIHAVRGSGCQVVHVRRHCCWAMSLASNR